MQIIYNKCYLCYQRVTGVLPVRDQYVTGVMQSARTSSSEVRWAILVLCESPSMGSLVRKT